MKATHYLTLALALTVVGTTGCDTGSRHDGELDTSSTNGGTNPNPNPNGGLQVTGVTPNSGSVLGGTAVSISGAGFSGTPAVYFFNPATESVGNATQAMAVVVVSANQITCQTPAHADDIVDVRVDMGSGNFATLNDAFTYGNGGGTNGNPLARVADFGNPSAADVELLELHNRARRDPAAEATRINAALGTSLNFSSYPARPPLAFNTHLGQAAKAHTADMIARNFYDHFNGTLGSNGRLLNSPYDLHGLNFSNNPIATQTESIGASSTTDQFDSPQEVHDAFIIDANVTPPKHRDNILGFGNPQINNREMGSGMEFDVAPNASPATSTLPGYTPFSPRQWVTEEFAHTNRNLAIISGVVYNDDGDGICEATAPYGPNGTGEGVGNVTVTLSHVSGFTISTQTSANGYYAFELLVPSADFTITINGQQTTVQVAADNVKVDLVNGTLRTY